MNQHDASYRQLFSSQHMVRSLFDGILQCAGDHGQEMPTADNFDWSRAQPLPTNFVAKGLQQRQSDCAWRIPRRDGSDLYVLLLLEHQSTVDTHMALRIMVYAGLLYQSLIKQGLIPADELYPPILPVVIYSGIAPWNATTRLINRISLSPTLRHLQPDIRYILLDEGQMLRHASLPQANLVTLLFQLEHCQDIEELHQLVQTLGKRLRHKRYDEVRHAFSAWIKYVLLPRAGDAVDIPNVNNLQEIEDMLTENTRSWTYKSRMEGIEKGRQEGEALLLQRQLTRRFGPLDQATQQLLRTGTPAQLETWSLNILDATTLDDVFRD